MIFLPYDKIDITTKLTDKQIVSRLRGITDTDKKFSFKKLLSSTDKTYFGTIRDNKFEIKRIIYYQNSFLPISFGSFEKTINGSTIRIKMRMNMVVNIFLSIICLGLLFFSIAFLLYADKSDNKAITRFIPLIMLFIIYILVMLFYKLESKKAKRDLIELLSADTNK